MNDCAGTTGVTMTAERRRMVPLYRLSSKILSPRERRSQESWRASLHLRFTEQNLIPVGSESRSGQKNLLSQNCRQASIFLWIQIKVITSACRADMRAGAVLSLLLYVLGPYHASVAADVLFSMIALSERWCLVSEEYGLLIECYGLLLFFMFFTCLTSR